MQTDPSKKFKLDPFAFPSETNPRFILLLVAAVSVTWIVGELILVLLVQERLIRSPAFSDLPTSFEFTNTGLNIEIAAATKNLSQVNGFIWIPTLLVMTVISIAGVIYRYHPLQIRHKKDLHKISYGQQPSLINEVHILSEITGVSPPPTVEICPSSRSVDGQAFGFHNHYSLCLGGRMRLLLCKAPGKFRAIVLHELAHITNGDIGRTYFAQALWIPVISFMMLYLVGTVLISFASSIQQLSQQRANCFPLGILVFNRLPITFARDNSGRHMHDAGSSHP